MTALRCASRCRARAFAVCLPVRHCAPVGDLALAGELALGLAHGRVGRPGARLGLALGGAGGELEAAQLLFGQRGLGIGVVLLAGEQAPEQASELARRGDDRDLVAAPGADALVERAQRAGLADTLQAASTSA